MVKTCRIVDDLYQIAGDDQELQLFEALYPVPDGMSYNSYVLLDKKIALFDTMDAALAEEFVEELEALLDGQDLSYIVVDHMEPDHSASLAAVADKYPNAQIVCTGACKKMIANFFNAELAERVLVVKDGDTLELGARTLQFVAAPNVHWPEVMMTYVPEYQVLMSADAFGTFGVMGDQTNDDGLTFGDMAAEMRRYYVNIVGKFGMMVTKALAKVQALDVRTLCPLHGPVLSNNVAQAVEAYSKWAAYEAEEPAVVIACGSVYGHTWAAATKLAAKLRELDVDVACYDLSVTHESYVVADAFRASNVVLASMTYENGMFPKMAELLDAFARKGLKNRRVSLIENGSWAPQSGKLMKAAVEELAGFELVGSTVTLKSSLADGQEAELDALAQAIAESLA